MSKGEQSKDTFPENRKRCPKTGRVLSGGLKGKWLAWGFSAMGLASLLWFLVRVIPKPSRAAYPCQRAAFPLASGFVLWCVAAVGSTLAWRRSREFARQSYHWKAWLCLTAAVAGAVAVWITLPVEPVRASLTEAHGPLGMARGIH